MDVIGRNQVLITLGMGNNSNITFLFQSPNQSVQLVPVNMVVAGTTLQKQQGLMAMAVRVSTTERK